MTHEQRHEFLLAQQAKHTARALRSSLQLATSHKKLTDDMQRKTERRGAFVGAWLIKHASTDPAAHALLSRIVSDPTAKEVMADWSMPDCQPLPGQDSRHSPEDRKVSALPSNAASPAKSLPKQDGRDQGSPLQARHTPDTEQPDALSARGSQSGSSDLLGGTAR